MSTKDWKGNSKSTHSVGGFASETSERADHDYYATSQEAVEFLLEIEDFDKDVPIWESACGEGHIAEVLVKNGYEVTRTDLILRKQIDGAVMIETDFLKVNEILEDDNFNLVTNPPYKYSEEWILKSLELMKVGNKLALFLPLRFLESRGRYSLFKDNPPICVHVASKRLSCAKNGNFKEMTGNTVCYCWFIWIKGYQGATELRWFNP